MTFGDATISHAQLLESPAVFDTFLKLKHLPFGYLEMLYRKQFNSVAQLQVFTQQTEHVFEGCFTEVSLRFGSTRRSLFRLPLIVALEPNGTKCQAEEYFNELHILIGEHLDFNGYDSPTNEPKHMHPRQLFQTCLAELLKLE